MTDAAFTAVPLVQARSRLSASLSALAALAAAAVLGGVILSVAGADPFDAYKEMVLGTFGGRFEISLVLIEMVPLLIIGLGLAVSFRARIWNIGSEGQFLIGALAGAAVALTLPVTNPLLLIPACFLAGATGGALVAALAGFLKNRWQVSEVITSLLLNYVAIFTVAYTIRQPLRDPVGFTPQTAKVPDASRLPDIPFLDVHAGLLIGLALVPVIAYVMRRTPFGFHLKMMGLNPEATRVAGVNIERLTMQVLALAGALAGLAGVIQVIGIETRVTNTISPGFGFTAIIVALVGRRRPLGVVIASFIIGALTLGGDIIQQTQQVPRVVVFVIEALFVLFLLIADRVGRR